MIEYACFIEKITRLYTIVNSYMKQLSKHRQVCNKYKLFYTMV